jgi:predicted AlkP superfamily phosphohydrolase/phosphomutase
MYREVRGFPPDLCVFFDDLAYRAVGSVGHGTVYLEDNDTGPDGCNHAWDGIFVLSGADTPRNGYAGTHAIYDVGRTVLGLMDLPVPAYWQGADRSGTFA